MLLPTTEAMIIYLVNVLIAFFVVMISDRIIAHNIEPKHALILAVATFFVTPIVAPIIGFAGIYASFLLPIVVWVLLGEIILQADWVTKLKVLVLAFFVYFVLSVLLGEQITSMINMIF